MPTRRLVSSNHPFRSRDVGLISRGSEDSLINRGFDKFVRLEIKSLLSKLSASKNRGVVLVDAKLAVRHNNLAIEGEIAQAEWRCGIF